MKTPLVIRVPGPPVGKERPRASPSGHFYTPPRTQAYEKTVRLFALQAMKASGWVKTEANVKIWVHAYVADKRRRDLDNLEKVAADSLNDLVWEDDSQIVESHAYKKLDRDNPRLEITVEVDDE